MKNYKIAAALFLLCILFSCDKYDLLRNNPKDPKSEGYKPSFKLSTNDATLVTITSATLGGKITSDQGVTVSAKGVCWNTATNPTIANSKTSDGTGVASYTSSLTGLTSSTLYYVRAYATTSSGTIYGDNIVTFTTLAAPTAPILTTNAASAIGLTNANGGGTISANGGSAITARGICWGTSANPTIALATKTVDDSTSVGAFTNKMTPLTAGTLYHVRAYATNSIGTSYGSDLTFTTLTVAVSPTLTTTAATGIAMTTAVSGGDISFDGGANVTDRGVCWSTTINPTILVSTKTSDGTGTGSFQSNITGLTAGVLYHVRAFATTSAGTGYGADVTFTTSTVAVAPTVTTAPVTDILLYTATAGGNAISDGGATITAKGVCWATTVNPTTVNSKNNYGSGTGAFSGAINLNLGTTYHLRAYATNSVGTSYGSDVTFTTLATAAVPTLTTTTVTAFTPNSAASGGNITSDGGATVTERGLCWSTTANPTMPTASKATDAGTGTGTYTGNITGLSGGTVYHVRAYAKNSTGYGYGSDLTFTTTAAVVPTITTTTLISNNAGISVTSGGNISSDGGAAVTVRGVCYSVNVNPSLTDSKTTDGPGSGVFVSNIIGLNIATAYHVRAYATNSVGTVYGQDVAFTTATYATLTTTTPITSITQTTATGGGNITLDGGSPVTVRGVCWGTSNNPTIAIASNRTLDGGGNGTYYSYIDSLSASTLYYVRAYATNAVGTAYGTSVTFTTTAPIIPTLNTSDISSVTLNTAVSGGDITADGFATITAKGVVWGTSTGPTVALSTKTTNTSGGAGTFTSNITGLSANSVYYIRAYATNIAGTGYGRELILKTSYGTLTDGDGNTYYTVQIGTQYWMRENLRTTKYRDGSFIANIIDNTAWNALSTGAYCWYGNDAANKPIYGALYNWYSTQDSRALCPTGSHIPTDTEWTTLSTFLGGSSIAGGKLRETGTTHWIYTGTETNETGFTALPGGYRSSYIGQYGYWWTSTLSTTTTSWQYVMNYYDNSLQRNVNNNTTGMSVRCILP